jgi:hypothetical protein
MSSTTIGWILFDLLFLLTLFLLCWLFTPSGSPIGNSW